jgi:hypothetical protein
MAATADGGETQAPVTVTIERASCGVSPRVIAAGSVVFRIANRSGRPAAFSVAGARTSVLPGRVKRLVVSVRAGAAAYVCTVAGRRIASGALRVGAAPQPSAEHRIGVRERDGSGEFYDRATGASFVPRGSNYIRLARQKNASGALQEYHSTFNVGRYDSVAAEAALSRMSADGFDVVRVFLSAICVDACMGDPATGSLRVAYIANVADFLRRAKNHGIFVLLTSEWLPPNTRYSADLASVRSDWFDNINVVMLSPEGTAAEKHLWTDVVLELQRQHAPIDAVFAFELWNEACLVADEPPFSLSAGHVTTANGSTYDMASAVDRKRMIDDGFAFLIDQVRGAIRKVDPTALVTMGFFHDTEPNPARRGDNRLVRTRAVIDRSTADFVDIHPYPGDEIGFAQLMQNYGIDGPVEKPIVIGEMGASRPAFAGNEDATTALAAWQRQSCPYGIDGWLLWTWDSTEQPDLWNALSGGGVIERTLAPRNRPDPCA